MDKVWSLINPDEPIRIEVQGVGVHIKALTNGEKVTIARKVAEFNEQEDSYNDMLRYVSQYIEKIEGFEGQDVADVLIRLENGKVQLEIVGLVTQVTGLDKKEEKNLSSSPAV